MTKELSSWMEFIHVLMDIIWQGPEPQSKPAWALQQNIMMPWPALQLSQHRYQKAIARGSTQWENCHMRFFWLSHVILPSNDLSINYDALAIARPVNQPWRSGNWGRFSEIFLGRSTISWFWKRRSFSALKVLFLYYSQGWQHWSLPYPRCTWCYTCDSSYITLLLLHHKVFVC